MDETSETIGRNLYCLLSYMYDKIRYMFISVYRTSLQLQIDDYINSTSIKQLGGK